MAACKKASKGKAQLRKEKEYDDNLELQTAIDRYFHENTGLQINEFSLARALGVSSVTLRRMKKDSDHPVCQYLVQSAYDRIADAVISDSAWNNKFMQQKSKQILESPIIAGYNTKVDVKSDNTVHVVFGNGADGDCMK